MKLKADLYLDSRDGLLKGGESGPAVVPGKPEESLLIKAMRHDEEADLEMPPKKRLPQDLVAKFEQWVRDGAVFPAPTEAEDREPDWWDELGALSKHPSVEAAVDLYINQGLERASLTPAAPADDHVLVRRLTLDLAGRISTTMETRAFVDSDDGKKRENLIERLINSPDYIHHQATELSWHLTDDRPNEFRDYLRVCLEEKRTWAEVFKDVIQANQADERTKGAAKFLRDRINDQDKLANSVSVKFFGVNISCAQCHDHPLVPDWKQDHYYGMKSFFSRTYDNGGFLAERDYGLIKFKTTKGKEKQAQLMFLSGSVIDEPESNEPDADAQKAEKKRCEEFKKNKKPLPPPAFSRRLQLIEAGLKPGEEGYFARAVVNHLWNRFMGRGLVMPLDQMHGQNRPSHPELLQWLAEDLVHNEFKLERLIRGIVTSDAYARTSRWDDWKRPDSALFAVATPRGMTQEQLGTSLHIAMTAPTRLEKAGSPEEMAKLLQQARDSGRGWTSEFERPDDDFQVSVDEALFFSNAERVRRELLNPGGDRLVGYLKGIADDTELVKAAVFNVLLRPPSEEELAQFSQYMHAREDRREQAIQQIVWALLASPEFRFNY